MQDTGIEWADHTINQYVGCTAISPGCDYCYAAAIEHRYGRDFDKIRRTKQYENGTLARFLRKTPAARIFADSMFDYFHEDFPLDQIHTDLEFLSCFPQHRFLILTKRIGKAYGYSMKYPLPKNVWIGTSIENRQYLPRLELLKKIPAHIRFVSFEPLLESVKDVDLDGIDWAIVGGESGPQHRPFDLEWAREIREACGRASVKFFFKQVGGINFKSGGRLLDGQLYNGVPDDSISE